MGRLKRKYQKPPGLVVVPDLVARPVHLSDLRALVLWTLAENGPPAPKFISVTNRKAIPRVFVLYIPGLQVDSFIDKESVQPQKFVSELDALNQFTFAWPTLTRFYPRLTISAENDFARVDLSKSEKKQKKQARIGSQVNQDLVSLSKLLLDEKSLKELGYPSSELCSRGFIQTESLCRDPKLFSIDCEMVMSGSAQVLARVTVVDDSEQVLYDTFVAPNTPVTDYLTAYSGVTKQHLENVSTSLGDVQSWVRTHISAQDVLVGHSLECDLFAMKVVHTRVIDTSVIFNHARGAPFKPSLKYLAKTFLDTEIQNGENGHDSVEDARACISLLNAKRQRGLDYGLCQLSVGIAEKLRESGKKTAIVGYGTSKWDDGHAQTVIACSSDEEVLEKAVKQCRTHDLTFASALELDRVQEKGLDTAAVGRSLNENLKKTFSSLPEGTLVVVFSGRGDTEAALRLLAKQKKYQSEYRHKKWDEIDDVFTQADEGAFVEAKNRARRGVAFMRVIGDDLAEDKARQEPEGEDVKKRVRQEPKSKPNELESKPNEPKRETVLE